MPIQLELTALQTQGYCFVPAGAARRALQSRNSLADWAAFADSWNGMPLDAYMADGGRYRRRRYAVYTLAANGQAQLEAPQPHWQDRSYNTLNGGVARWFEPIPEAIASGETMQAALAFVAEVFGALAPQVTHWHAEVHQFRIEAGADTPGQPTPEGAHRDGVDYVLVLLVARNNIAEGTTTVSTPDGKPLGAFTLVEPCDVVLVDDARVYHGVTPVLPLHAGAAAYRDVLVVTLRRRDDSRA